MFFLFTGGWQATSPGPCDPSSGPFLERIVRRRTASAGCRPFFIISDPNPNSPLFTMRVGKRTTMPVGSRTGHRQNDRFESDATFRDRHTISIATQQRTNETIVRAARIYFIKIYSSIFIKNTINYQTFTGSHPEASAHGGIPAFSHRPVEPPNIRSTRHSPRTREMRPVLPLRTGFASSLQPVFPSFHAHRDRPPAESRFRQGRTDTDEIFIVWARSLRPPQDMPGKRSS